MTIRDAEVIEVLSDQPELLAIADAVSAIQPVTAKPSRRRRRGAVRVAILAAVVAAAIVAILAAPQGRSGVIGKALAAIGNGPIVHVVTEFKPGTLDVNLKTGHRTAQVWREELWADRSLDHLHLVLSGNGRLIGDVLYPQDVRSGSSPPVLNPAFVALWTGYRAALQNGSVTLAGRGTVAGRPVYWLRFKVSGPSRQVNEVAVDAHTYKPVVYRTVANGRHFDQRILVAKTVPFHASDFKRRGPSLFNGSGGSSSGSSGGEVGPPGSPPTGVVHAPWLSPGPTVAGLTLRSVDPLSETTDIGGKHSKFRGIELLYGPGASTTIDELPRPDFPEPWRGIRPGTMLVERGSESSGGGSHATWTGYVIMNGRYVTISTPAGERALIAIARSLHKGRG
jgi:hypothetical protein